MNPENHTVIINGEDKTFQVESIRLDGHRYAIKFQNSDKTYSYSKNNVLWLTNPLTLDIGNCHIYANGRRENNVMSVLLFVGDSEKFYAIKYANGFVRHFPEKAVNINRSCIVGKAAGVFDYMHQCARISTLGADEDDVTSEGILPAIYSKIDYVDEKTAAAVYLNSQHGIKKSKIDKILFPFGCNASQERAVKAALSNQISVIQGPPGTGKTQTILNIIANLLVAGKSILVVSNNNSATENVLEKLSKNGLGFLVAPLGNRKNKEAFIANQPSLNPELSSWNKSGTELRHAVKIELLPLLKNREQTGIIAPYNKQVDQFQVQIPDVEVATVHKYQGREKDVIIMSVTDDVITEFADNANLLNVAVSRAKDKFCLVVTGNPQELKGNTHDLLEYIRYQQGTIMQSKLRSIFDYLFSHVEQFRRENDSEYASENLTFDLIEKIRTKYPHLSHIKALRNYPMRYLICDTSELSEREAKYALHSATHIDFLIINRVTKEPLLAIETDGYSYHNEQTEQFHRDRMKDHILANYGLPLLRLSTVGHSEEQRIVDALGTYK